MENNKDLSQLPIKLELPLEDVNAALIGLGKLPAEQSFKAIVQIRQQTQPQVDSHTQVSESTGSTPELLTEENK